MDNKKMFEEMVSNSKYKELLLTSPYFNKILQIVSFSNTSEIEIVEIISVLCERIAELEKDL